MQKNQAAKNNTRFIIIIINLVEIFYAHEADFKTQQLKQVDDFFSNCKAAQ